MVSYRRVKPCTPRPAGACSAAEPRGIEPFSACRLNIELLDAVISALAMGKALPEKNKDHALTGNWAGHRECHTLPDWLLIYRIEDDVLVLTLSRTGAHSNLFGK